MGIKEVGTESWHEKKHGGGQSATQTYLVIENDLETLSVGTNSLPSDSMRTTSAPLGIVIRAGDLDGIDNGQKGKGG
jgi:hypothetical protein